MSYVIKIFSGCAIVEKKNKLLQHYTKFTAVSESNAFTYVISYTKIGMTSYWKPIAQKYFNDFVTYLRLVAFHFRINKIYYQIHLLIKSLCSKDLHD